MKTRKRILTLATVLLLTMTIVGCNKDKEPEYAPDDTHTVAQEEDKDTEIEEDIKESIEELEGKETSSEEVKTEEELKELGFTETEIEMYQGVEDNLKADAIVYKERANQLEVTNFDEHEMTANGEKIGLLIFSRMSCPVCLTYLTHDDFQEVMELEGVKVNYINTRGEIYQNPDVHEMYPVRAVPSIVILNKDGSRWYPADEVKEELESKEIRLETTVDREGAELVYLVGGYPAELLQEVLKHVQ